MKGEYKLSYRWVNETENYIHVNQQVDTKEFLEDIAEDFREWAGENPDRCIEWIIEEVND